MENKTAVAGSIHYVLARECEAGDQSPTPDVAGGQGDPTFNTPYLTALVQSGTQFDPIWDGGYDYIC